MKIFFDISPIHFDVLTNHLFPSDSQLEEAAFLFAEEMNGTTKTVLVVRDIFLVKRTGFKSQNRNYLELDNDVRNSIIKRAHFERLSLIEAHSHRGSYPAAFSDFDIFGLRETVRHMKWRLKSRPYGALVFSPGGFDALIWLGDSCSPQEIDAIRIGGQLRKPTKLSITAW